MNKTIDFSGFSANDLCLISKCVGHIAYKICLHQVLKIADAYDYLCVLEPALVFRYSVFTKALEVCRKSLVITGFKNGYAYQTVCMIQPQKAMADYVKLMSAKQQ